jgi:hypothetical protein
VDPDYVPWPCLFHGLSLLREKLLRAGEPDRFARARIRNRFSRLESPRTDTREGDPVAMLRIHVRLDLEHEGTEAGIQR